MQAAFARDESALETEQPWPQACPWQQSLAEWQSCDFSCPAHVSRVLDREAINTHFKRGMQAWRYSTDRRAHTGAVLSAWQPSRSASV